MKYYPTFNDLFFDFMEPGSFHHPEQAMKTDIVEKGENFEMTIEMPGVKKEDIKMELKDGYLKVSAVHNSNKEDKDNKGRIVRQERFSGTYSRSFYVGEGMREEDVRASFENGELMIVVPKEAPKKLEETKYIPIQ